MNWQRWLSRFRFTLAGFLCAVLLIAVGMATLMSDSSWVASWMRSGYLCLMGLAVVGACLRRGARQAYWIAILVFGLGYQQASGVDLLNFQSANNVNNPYGYSPYMVNPYWAYGQYPSSTELPQLPTSRWLEWLATHRNGGHHVGDHVMALWQQNFPFPATLSEEKDGQFLAKWDDGDVPLWITPSQILGVSGTFYKIGHLAIGMLLALAAGWFCSCLFGETGDANHQAVKS